MFREPFAARRGATQGGPVSPTIFNIMVDAVVREWLRQTLGNEAITSGIGEEIRSFLAAFYADDGILQSWDPIRLQTAADILVGLFERVGLKTNTSKTQAMVCTLGKMRQCQSQAVYNRRMTGVGEAERYHGRRVTCDICGDGLAARLLQSHLATQHDVHTNVALSSDLLDLDWKPRTYWAKHPFATGLHMCPVLGCEGEAPTKYGLQRNFA